MHRFDDEPVWLTTPRIRDAHTEQRPAGHDGEPAREQPLGAEPLYPHAIDEAAGGRDVRVVVLDRGMQDHDEGGVMLEIGIYHDHDVSIAGKYALKTGAPETTPTDAPDG